MSELYLCVNCDSQENLIDLLASNGRVGRIDGPRNGVPLVAVPNPDGRLLRFTAELLRAERLRSAGLFVQRLHPDELYIAAEWWGRMVVEADLVGQSDVFGGLLVLEKTYDPRSLSISYDPRSLSIFKVAPMDTDKVPFQELPDIGPIAAIQVPATEILNDPRRYYGEFVEEEVGGANALYAAGLEAAREQGLPEGQVLVGDPRAFGFDVDAGEESIVGWMRKGVISAEATGFGLGYWGEAQRLYTACGQELDLRDLERRAEEWSHKGFRFGVAIILAGIQDPPVVIPTGAVFQQPSMGSPMQTLGIA